MDSIAQLTDDGQIKSGRLATDGIRIYFNEGPPLSQKIGQVSIKGGPTLRVESRLVNPSIAAITRDGSELIVQAGGGTNLAYPLWAIPLPAGEPRRLGDVELMRPVFRKTATSVFAVGKDLFIANEDGSNPRKLSSLPGRVASIETSPNGQRVLLELDTKGESTFDTFEMAADGAGVLGQTAPPAGMNVVFIGVGMERLSCTLPGPETGGTFGHFLLTQNFLASQQGQAASQRDLCRSRGVPLRVGDNKQIFAIALKSSMASCSAMT